MDEPRELPESEPEVEQVQQMPRWIGLLIGVVLVSLAALAAYTGLRYRSPAAERSAVTRQTGSGPLQAGPPGAPQAGGARMGEAGEHVPDAQPADQGRQPRVEITGGPGGVVSTVRYIASRGAAFVVEPADASIYVNGEQIGLANQFSGPDEVYEFPGPGKYRVRISAPGHRDETVILTADPQSLTEIATVTRKMTRTNDR